MKVSCLYDQGSAPHREDGLILADPFFGVLDGVSAPYGPKNPGRKFSGMSGGEFVARTVEKTFIMEQELRNSGSPLNLPTTVVWVNHRVLADQRDAGVPKDAGEIAGATFAIAKMDPGMVHIVQAGDCFALSVMRSGKIGITRNQVRLHDEEMNAEILRIQREVSRELFGKALEEVSPEERGKIRGEMWNRFSEFLKQARREDANNPKSSRCYGLMNGDPRLSEAMVSFSFRREELQVLLLFSDGMVPWEAMKGWSDEEMARRVWNDFREGGLAHLFRIARGIERRVAAVNYTDSAEATAIALDFSDEN